MATSTRVKVPTFNSDTDEYDTYINEVNMWQIIGKVDKKEQAMMLIYSLSKEDSSGIRDKIMNELSLTDLNKEEGMDKYINYMNEHFKKDDSVATYEAYLNFERCRKSGDEEIKSYIMRFDKQSNIAKKKKVTYPNLVLAFKLLDNCLLTEVDRKLVLSEMDFTKEDEVYERTKKALLKYKSNNVCSKTTEVKPESEIKTEEVMITRQPFGIVGLELEQALVAAGWQRPRSSSNPERGRGAKRFQGRRHYHDQSINRTQGKNPFGRDGIQLKCFKCQSTQHMKDQCPKRDTRNPDNAFISQMVTLSDRANHLDLNNEEALCAVENIVLYAGNNKYELRTFCQESVNCGILDSACTSNVCGSEWLQTLIASFSREECDLIIIEKGVKRFKFGGDEILQSKMSVTFYCSIVGIECKITTDVVESSIPLLLSIHSMEKLEMIWDVAKGKAQILGKWTELIQMSIGHYGIDIKPRMPSIGNEPAVKMGNEVCLKASNEICLEAVETCLISLQEDDEGILEAQLRRLHRQFGHPSEKRWELFMKLCREGVWTKKKKQIMERIYEKCETCKVFKKTPPKPVVKLPITCEFNKIVTLDLKEKKTGRFNYILHVIDAFTRLSASAFITNKQTDTVVNQFARIWISVGYGSPGKMWTDVGNEFNSDSVKELSEAFSFEVSTGAGYSAWMNGLNERNHGVIDRTFEKITYDNPTMDPEVALAWAVNAKNCFPMNNGFSSFQLVFGKNPQLPNILNDTLPGLEGVSTSKAVSEHITALHSGRKAFAEVQCDEQTRRALRHKVRAVEKRYEQGSKVYYKRDGQDRWRGPATVIGNDGSVYFLRHQGSLYRVPSCRIIDIEYSDTKNTTENSDVNINNTCSQNDAPEALPENRNLTIIVDRSNETNNQPPQDSHNSITPASQIDDSMATSSAPAQTSIVETSPKTFPKVGDKIEYKAGSGDDAEWFEVDVFGRGKKGGRNENYLNVRYNDGSVAGINIEKHDWRRKTTDESNASENERVEEALVVMVPWRDHNLPECQVAKDKEMLGWKENNTYDEVDDEGQRTIESMWILTEKVIDGKKAVKARLVAMGNQEKADVQSDSPTGTKDALFLVFAIGSMNTWRPKTTDVKNAFLQGQKINRTVYLKPPKDLKKDGKIWRLNKCVYGLDDAARSWFLEVEEDLKTMGCVQSKVDICVFFYFSESELCGIVFLHVDDFLHMGDALFEEKVIVKIRTKYRIGKSEDGSFVYTGLNIHDSPPGIRIDQLQYIPEISSVTIPTGVGVRKDNPASDEGRTQLRRSVGQANWAARRTRPDVGFDLMELSMKFNSATVDDLRRANKVIGRLKTEEVSILFPRLSGKEVSIKTYSDASFANLIDGVSSGRGHVVFLVDESDRCSPLHWTTNKVKRVVHSTLAAEALSLQQCLSTAEYIRYILAEAWRVEPNKIPIFAYIDNNDLYSALHSTTLVSDKKLRIDIAAIKQTMSEENVAVKWLRSSEMIADCLTKKGADSTTLMSVIRQGQLPTYSASQ